MPAPETMYVFTPAERAIYAEIYFPKKVVYQPAIFYALRYGHDEKIVRTYLRDNVEALLTELKEYRQLLNPHQYEFEPKRGQPPTLEEARRRIDVYVSYYKGWSMYEVDGVWEATKPPLLEGTPALPVGEEEAPRLVEERTQVIRLMFRLPSTYEEEARHAGCFDVLRAIIYWTIGIQGSLNEHRSWSRAEQARFMVHHTPWPKKKAAFARRYFARVAKEVEKWIDDCGLFIFGYLVRKFAENVLKEKEEEAEIWVTSFFTLGVNVIKRVEKEPPSPHKR